MLTHLAIANLALIEAADLGFVPGFTALTGETGAGKSLLLDALGLALGERADFALMRPGCLTTDISASFKLPLGYATASPALAALLEEQGLECDDENQLSLRRQLKANAENTDKTKRDITSKGWINGVPVAATVLAKLADFLLDVHSQHATQHLFVPAHQRDMFDKLAGLGAERTAVGVAFTQFQALTREHAVAAQELSMKSLLAETQAVWRQELEELAYQPDEEIELAEKRARAGQGQQLAGALTASDEALNNAAQPAMRVAGKALQQATKFEDSLAPLCDKLFNLLSQLEDLSHDLARQSMVIQGEELDVEKIDDRLHGLRGAARKHRVDVSELPGVLAELTLADQNLAVLNERVQQLAYQQSQAQAALVQSCEKLTAGRHADALKLEQRLMLALRDLHLPHAQVQVKIMPLATMTAAGAETVELMFSANPGLPAQPLGKVASGGELSRVMLALKTVFFEALPAQTIVLDEVDGGLSGPTAAAVGRAMAKLAEKHQVLAVTHHPQVAAAAQAHLCITKQQGKTTHTQVAFLTGAARTEELARLLAGEKITAAARAAAVSLQAEMSGRPVAEEVAHAA